MKYSFNTALQIHTEPKESFTPRSWMGKDSSGSNNCLASEVFT